MTNHDESNGLSRRDIFVVAAATALTAGVPAAAMAAKRRSGFAEPSDIPVNRYMAATAVLPDGKILIAGGYSRPWIAGNRPPAALSSAMILDPFGGAWIPAAPMMVPRARHAAVTLPDGRVAMVGGIGLRPTDSVEIYDPRTDSWHAGPPLAQPRYDHSAVVAGDGVFVLGGSAQSIVSGVEVLRLSGAEMKQQP